MILGLLIAAATIPSAAVPSATPSPPAAANVATNSRCPHDRATDILICGQSPDRYRIDPAVLSAIRVRETPPPKPELSADMAATTGCVGPQACGGDYIPLVEMALVVAKAAALAVKGDDWRDALRTHEDDYRLYQQAEARKASARRPRIGIGLTK